jgi:rhamnosyltransferase
VTVAIPVRDGEAHLDEVLAAVRGQELERPLEILVADSGSRDRSVEIARRHGARVIPVEPAEFSHGGTRQMLMREARGEHVAFLTQDALPVGPRWLAGLLGGFELDRDVALAFGPYRPRPGATLPVRRELVEYFRAMAPDEAPRVHRDPRGARAPTPETFFSDVNGCVARWASEQVPFRSVPYAEDRLLAHEMLLRGWAVAFEPEAAVVHSHDYGPVALFRRYFDEFRGLREVLGHTERLGLRSGARRVRGEVSADLRFLRAEGAGPAHVARALPGSIRHHATRAIGASLGSHADRLPAWLRRACSLERRASFEPFAGGGAESSVIMSGR